MFGFQKNKNSEPEIETSPTNLIDMLDFDKDDVYTLDKIAGCVDENAEVAAIVLAGGEGTRMGSLSEEGGKTLIKMAGKPVLTWSMDTFDAIPQIGLIVVVVPEDKFEEYIEVVVDPFAFQTPVVMACAGESRQESAFNGLDMVPDKFQYVLVHDGARPLVPVNIVQHLISTLKADPDLDGVICATPAIDTLKVVENGQIVGTPDRSVFWSAQTPQAFVTSTYREAHLEALADGFAGTDDSSLMERIGCNIEVIEGKRNNIKLTVPEDRLVLASVLHSMKIKHGSEYNI